MNTHVGQDLACASSKGVCIFENLCISGTRHHSTLAGFGQCVMIEVPTLGFMSEALDVIVISIVDGVAEAHKNQWPGMLKVNRDTLVCHQRQRYARVHSRRQPPWWKAEMIGCNGESVVRDCLAICRCDLCVELLVGHFVRSFAMLVKSIADVEEDSMEALADVKDLQIQYNVSAVQSSASRTDKVGKIAGLCGEPVGHRD